MNKTSFIALVLLLAGCGSSLDTSFTNFSAYYNTYYNAKEDYQSGLSKVEDQPITINPDMPIRPHPQPLLAGEQDFENAVDNAAQILRRFSDSKWMDDALLLMGKSYYYMQEYFLARQKFDELLALPQQSSLKQRAVIWKARTLLEIDAHTEGIQFLENQLRSRQWSVPNRAEARILLAEHHVMLGHWGEAADILEPAILKIQNRALRGRSYFLLGQAFQQLNELNLAFQAYSNVARNFPDYEYVYHAEIKKADMAAKQGNVALAISLYQKMLNDDKNFKRSNKINYQLARAYEAVGNFDVARDIYKQILSNSSSVSGLLKSNTYYQLGQLYSRRFDNYKLAAAYFDSSSLQADQQSGAEADRLASAYNRYIALREQIARVDSLLALGALSDNELKIKLAEIRQQRQEMLKESENQIQQTNNLLSNIEGETIYNDQEPSAGAMGFGFLNYQNSENVQRERRQFRAVWGDRPLVDNWRRIESISGAAISEQRGQENDSAASFNQPTIQDDTQLGIDTRDIPRSPETRRTLRQEGANAQYRLGSLFFLTLQQPDSAAYYYRNVLQDSTTASLRAQTLYSLYELYNLQQRPDSAAKYREMILTEHSNTSYAQRIKNNQQGNNAVQDTIGTLKKRIQKLLMQDETGEPQAERAERLYKLAIENQATPLASEIFYESIRAYIQYAKFRDKNSISDSLNTTATDSTSVMAYQGPHWDRVRALIDEFQNMFPHASQIEQVRLWGEMLSEPTSSQAIYTCKELDVAPTISPNQKAFLDSITLPDEVKGMNLSGTIRYRVIIEKDGSVSSFELLSRPTNLGIEKAYERAIEQSLRYEPVRQNGDPVRVTCTVEFPIRQ